MFCNYSNGSDYVALVFSSFTFHCLHLLPLQPDVKGVSGGGRVSSGEKYIYIYAARETLTAAVAAAIHQHEHRHAEQRQGRITGSQHPQTNSPLSLACILPSCSIRRGRCSTQTPGRKYSMVPRRPPLSLSYWQVPLVTSAEDPDPTQIFLMPPSAHTRIVNVCMLV